MFEVAAFGALLGVGRAYKPASIFLQSLVRSIFTLCVGGPCRHPDNGLVELQAYE